MTISFLTSRRFAPLFWCQCLSVLSCTFAAAALIFVILPEHSGARAEAMIAMAGALFIGPFVLLSGLGGELADRFDKAFLARRLQLAGIGASLLAAAGFALDSAPILFDALFLLGVIAALFRPVAYASLPEHLARDELAMGNALLEGGTCLAILLGMMGGAAATRGGETALFGSLILIVSLLCWGAALAIPRAGEPAVTAPIDVDILRSTRSVIHGLWDDRRLAWGGLAVGLFWLVVAITLSVLPRSLKQVLGGSDASVITYLAVFGIGVAIGGQLAAWLLRGRIMTLPTLIGSAFIGIFFLDLGFALSGVLPGEASSSSGRIFGSGLGLRAALDLFGLGAAGGLVVVPAFAAVEAWAPADRRARIVAAVDVLSATSVAVGCLASLLASTAGLRAGELYLTVGALGLVATAAFSRTLPTNPFRDLVSILYRALFRLEVRGAENFAAAGPGAVIALNHVSFLDAGLALSLLDEDPVFAIDDGIAQRWWVKPFLRVARAIPLNPLKPMATRTLINVVRSGDTLVIFPEGRLTVTGSLMKVYDGAGLVADKTNAKIVPVHIDGLDATYFSYLTAQQIRKRLLPKVTVTVLEPIELTVDPTLKGRARRHAAGTALYDIMSNLVFRTTSTNRTIIDALVDTARAHGWRRIAVEDPVSGASSYRRLLAGAATLGAELAPLAAESGAVAVMLPSSIGATVTLLGLVSAGRVPAMINFTAGPTNILAACRAAEVTALVTSRAFVEKARLDELVVQLAAQVRIVYLEEVHAGIGLADKVKGLLRASKPLVARGPDDPAAILFTSGSEGAPKGVVLSHRNMLANAAQAAARIDFGRTDKVFNVLPVFHSFGFTVGLVLPLVSGVRTYLYPSPLHYRTVPELIYSTNATIMFGTDTFLTGYARSANPYDFRSLRYVLAGAEPVREATRSVYSEKFGVRILEGYGVTETAPVIALNTPMFNRFGTVGRLMPGIEARLEPVPGIRDGGRLLVKGPNVMLGYLRAGKPGVLEPPPEGWHDTGDIVAIDRDGFLTIEGRAKRFAKIGGEMISLAAVESLTTELWPEVPSAVVAVPDLRKGEKLVLVTQQADAARSRIQAFAKSKGAADMMIPAEILVVEKVPLLGSGKIDHPAVAALVREHFLAARRVGESAGSPVADSVV
jgi:acyl-[acyl-carrier-protein]-phospholipid O-acyltransferase/long-chain-fatty-acid--[acyl-carrier-protein] ligase